MKAPSLIPFVVGLIGYESCIKDSPDVWKYGPEYTFNVGVNSSILVHGKGDFLCSNVTIFLKCRPFNSKSSDERTDGLQCYVKDANITNYEVIMNVKPSKIVQDKPKSPFEIGNRKFEIIYDKKKIKEFRVEPKISSWHLNMIRAIANQLNIGFDRFDKGGERFALVEDVGPEDSTIGICETKFEVSKQLTDKVKHWNNSKCENKMHLETYAYGKNNPMIAIDKIRDTNKCLPSTPYVFGADEVKKDKLSLINIKMVKLKYLFNI
ncbi:hypothetical protein PV325_013548 [Microctonus aethiopoides]|nr:hypothetical protein PV325_013548 [Microctonus aethiopoides]